MFECANLRTPAMARWNPWSRLVDNISSKLAFFPPAPSTYEVLSHSDGTGEEYIQPVDVSYPRVQCKVKLIPSGREKIVTAFLEHKQRGKAAKATLLYSHGNAVDLGQMLPLYRELCRLLNVNIMSYDYTGYGCSSGRPSVAASLQDIEAVYGCLVHEYSVEPSSVVLYGQSVGSGPAAHMAASGREVAGVVLHTPILSGVRVLNPKLRYWPSWLDVFPNHLLIPKITQPVMVLHGTADEVIHFSCGQRAYELAPNKAPPLWAEGFDHQNLETCPEYVPALRAFLDQLFGKDR